jgi:flagellar biosynthesis chaperone FliJ
VLEIILKKKFNENNGVIRKRLENQRGGGCSEESTKNYSHFISEVNARIKKIETHIT